MLSVTDRIEGRFDLGLAALSVRRIDGTERLRALLTPPVELDQILSSAFPKACQLLHPTHDAHLVTRGHNVATGVTALRPIVGYLLGPRKIFSGKKAI